MCFNCILWGISKTEAVNRLNNSMLEDFGANKRLIEIIREGAFGSIYFRDIYSGGNGKWYRKSWKEFDQLKNVNQECYCSSYFDMKK